MQNRKIIPISELGKYLHLYPEEDLPKNPHYFESIGKLVGKENLDLNIKIKISKDVDTKEITYIYNSETPYATEPDKSLYAIIDPNRNKVHISGCYKTMYSDYIDTAQTAEVTIDSFAVEKIEFSQDRYEYALLLLMGYTKNSRQFFRIEKLFGHYHKSFDCPVTEEEEIRKLEEKLMELKLYNF